MDIYEQITKMADEIAPELVAQRRDFHKFAEKGWFEMRTSSIIARKLTEMGYEVLVGDQVCKKDARMGVPLMRSWRSSMREPWPRGQIRSL